MAKKSRADIMEKLSALRPSEPTKTRGKAARKTAVKTVRAKKAVPSKKPKADTLPGGPKPAAPPVQPWFPGYAGCRVLGDASKTVLGVYETWYQIIRRCSGAAADCNDMVLRSLSAFMSPGRWWRF